MLIPMVANPFEIITARRQAWTDLVASHVRCLNVSWSDALYFPSVYSNCLKNEYWKASLDMIAAAEKTYVTHILQYKANKVEGLALHQARVQKPYNPAKLLRSKLKRIRLDQMETIDDVPVKQLILGQKNKLDEEEMYLVPNIDSTDEFFANLSKAAKTTENNNETAASSDTYTISLYPVDLPDMSKLVPTRLRARSPEDFPYDQFHEYALPVHYIHQYAKSQMHKYRSSSPEIPFTQTTRRSAFRGVLQKGKNTKETVEVPRTKVNEDHVATDPLRSYKNRSRVALSELNDTLLAAKKAPRAPLVLPSSYHCIYRPVAIYPDYHRVLTTWCPPRPPAQIKKKMPLRRLPKREEFEDEEQFIEWELGQLGKLIQELVNGRFVDTLTVWDTDECMNLPDHIELPRLYKYKRMRTSLRWLMRAIYGVLHAGLSTSLRVDRKLTLVRLHYFVYEVEVWQKILHEVLQERFGNTGFEVKKSILVKHVNRMFHDILVAQVTQLTLSRTDEQLQQWRREHIQLLYLETKRLTELRFPYFPRVLLHEILLSRVAVMISRTHFERNVPFLAKNMPNFIFDAPDIHMDVRYRSQLGINAYSFCLERVAKQEMIRIVRDATTHMDKFLQDVLFDQKAKEQTRFGGQRLTHTSTILQYRVPEKPTVSVTRSERSDRTQNEPPSPKNGVSLAGGVFMGGHRLYYGMEMVEYQKIAYEEILVKKKEQERKEAMAALTPKKSFLMAWILS